MTLNPIGLTAAITAFLTIWFGHVAVRKIEFASATIWIPTAIFAAFGILTEYFSLITNNQLLSTALGIFGITLLFDALEFTRQQNRIKKGHAPANPNNPRHALILADSNFHATTINLLKREPAGSPLPVGEGLGVRERP